MIGASSIFPFLQDAKREASHFFWFIFPTGCAMILFIALPIVSVIIQSLFVQHEQVLVVSENCDPFGCTQSTKIDLEATESPVPDRRWGSSTASAPTSTAPISRLLKSADAWARAEGFGEFWNEVSNLPFYRALTFTLTYTFFVTPLVLILGLVIAAG